MRKGAHMSHEYYNTGAISNSKSEKATNLIQAGP